MSRSGAKRARTEEEEEEEEERNVVPRHFHANEHSNKASVVTNVGHLYRHALQIVFDFCTLTELHACIRVSKSWQTGVAHVPCLPNNKITLNTRDEAACFVLSTLRRRIHRVALREEAAHPETLMMLSYHVPTLKHLEMHMDRSSMSPFIFPLSLLSLHIELDFPVDHSSTEADNAVLRSISKCRDLTSLVLKLNIKSTHSLAPLVALSQLQELKLNFYSNPVSDEQIHQLRDIMTSLTRLMIDDWNPFLLNPMKLLMKPCEFPLQHIDGFPCVGEESGALLAALPNLTSLWLIVCHNTPITLEWLPSLTCLRELTLDIGCNQTDTANALILSSIQQCKKLESLSVHGVDPFEESEGHLEFTDDQMKTLLRSMPLITTLYLDSICLVRSLSFLSVAPQIVELGLLNFHHRLSINEVNHILTLRHLQHLNISGIFDEPLTSYASVWFTPPSLLLPELCTFNYNHEMPELE